MYGSLFFMKEYLSKAWPVLLFGLVIIVGLEMAVTAHQCAYTGGHWYVFWCSP
jgi:hypothetical protein